MKKTMYKIDEISDLYVDAFLSDQSQLIFLSVWGRDTALQEFFARLSLPKSEQGLREIHLENIETHQTHFIDIPDIETLGKTSGRAQSNIFGQLSHVFIYDKLAVKPDALNNRALLFYQEQNKQPDIWDIVKEACHLPLLDHWEKTVLRTFEQQGWIQTLTGVGIHAIKISLAQQEVEQLLALAIKEGHLTLKEGEKRPPDVLNQKKTATKLNSLVNVKKSAQFLKGFMSARQLDFILEACRGEEGQFFIDKLAEMTHLIETMPKTGETENIEEPLAYLHYFTGSFDWYISEKDKLDEQFQAFGVANMGYPEYGYISITELIENGVELDLHFKPETLKVLKKRLDGDLVA